MAKPEQDPCFGCHYRNIRECRACPHRCLFCGEQPHLCRHWSIPALPRPHEPYGRDEWGWSIEVQ